MSVVLVRCSISRLWRGGLLFLTLAAVAGGQTRPAAASPAQSEPDRKLTPLEKIQAAAMAVGRAGHDLNQQPEVRNLYEAASALAQNGKYEAAVDRLNAALNRSTDDYYELLYLMATAKFRLGADGEARVYASQAAQAAPAAADAQYLLGEICRRQAQLEAAIAHYRAATLAASSTAASSAAANPRITAAWFRLAECLAQDGWLTAAYEAYTRFDEAIWEDHPAQREAEEIAPLLADRPLGALQERVELLKRLGRYADAIKVGRAALARWSDSVPVQRIVVRTLLAAGQPEEALALCRQRWPEESGSDFPAPDSSPRALPLLTETVQAICAAGQLAVWTAELEKQVSAGKSVALAGAVADRLSEPSDLAFAARLWDVVAAQRPQEAEPVWAAAVAQRASGDLAGAAEKLIEFVRSHPDNEDLPWKRLAAWLEGDEASAADVSKFLERQMGGSGRDFAADFVLAMLAARAGQDELAETLFSAGAEARPDFALAQVAWAQSLSARYEWEAAEAHAQAALEAAPRLGAAHFALATVYAGLDQNDDAESEYRAAIKDAPQDVDFLVALGHFYKRHGDLLGAQRYFQQALTADPNNGEALENLVESYLAGGKPGLARAQFHEAESVDLPDAALRRARTALRFSETPFGPEHLAALKRQFAADPRDLETGLKLTAGLLVRGSYDEAFQYAQALQREFPGDPRTTVVLSRLLSRRLEFRAAGDLLEALVARYPNRTEPLKLLAVAQLADFQLEPARRTIQHLIELAKTDTSRAELRAQLLLSYVGFSEFEPALQLLDEWTAAEPQNATWWREKLRVLALAGREQEALDLAAARVAPLEDEFQRKLGDFKRLLDEYKKLPDEDLSMRTRAENLQAELKRIQADLRERRAEFVQVGMQVHRYQEVETQLHEWLVDQPGNSELTQWLVLLLIQDNRPDEALCQLDAFSATGVAAEAAVRGWRAEAEAAAGHADKAAGELDALLEDSAAGLSARDRAEIWAKLIEILIDAQRYDDALARCDEWLSELPAREQAMRSVVERSRLAVLAAAGRRDQYLSEAERLLQADPDDTALNNDLGYSWIDAGVNARQALEMIRKAVADEPLRAAYLDSLGWAYYKTGDFGQACEFLQRAVRLREGRESVIFDHLGDASFRSGDREAARRHWQKALEMVQEEGGGAGMTRPADLAVRIRAKLAALEDGKEPEVAPTAGKR
jgi:tetratricopeptide (TPR) repeat protein